MAYHKASRHWLFYLLAFCLVLLSERLVNSKSDNLALSMVDYPL